MAMRNILLLALITPLASGSCSQGRPCPDAVPAQPAPAAEAAPDYAALDTYIRGAMSNWGVPGLAIAVMQDDSVVFAQGYGVRRLGDPEPVDVRTLFGLLSPTKTMAAAALGILVDEGRISWDDRVVDHLPGFRVSDPVATREIRIQDLLSNGTGYQEDHRLWYDRGGTTADVARRTEELERVAPLGTEFHYNNIMFVVAGEVIAAVAGVPWDTFVRERIFQPLGMSRSTTSVRALEERTNVASPHARRVFGRLGPVRPIEYLDIDNIGLAGSLHTNAVEAAQWLRMLLNHGVYEGDRVLEAGTVSEMGRPQVPLPAEFVGSPAFAPLCGFVDFGSISYGLGWFVMSYRGHHTLIHGGGINGQRSAVALLPGQRAGVVILSNLQDTEIALALAWTVLDLFLDVDPRDWSAAYLNPD
jgi:CubicO group peptidase (beta-lactamase class C family)